MIIKSEPSSFIVDELYDLEELKKTKGDNGNYSYFILKKTNLTMQQAIIAVAKSVGITSKRIHYCGTKDKVAITTQLISIQKSNTEFAQRILDAIKESEDIELTYLGQFNQRLNLSDNIGNKFTITINELNENEIKLLENKPQQFEVFNCFQSQRFGMCKNTHAIGLLLIQQNVKDALFEVLRTLPSKYIHEFEEYLGLIENVHINFDELTQEELSGEFLKIKEVFPNFLKGYISCIKHLIYHPKDVSGAFRTIPKKIRTLYVHAFQSAIFNELLLKYKDSLSNSGILYLAGFDLNENDLLYSEMKSILERLGLTFEDLKLPHMPELCLYKTEKEIKSKVNNYEFEKKSNDTVQIKFELGKGAYATQVIDELLDKNEIITFFN